MLFAREQTRRRFTSPERDSLLPLADELPRVAGVGPCGDSHRADAVKVPDSTTPDFTPPP